MNKKKGERPHLKSKYEDAQAASPKANVKKIDCLRVFGPMTHRYSVHFSTAGRYDLILQAADS